jgi:2-polyprenyl-6-methoxyphenol hydroxylase-like FAD-dependent oxidoreductase
LPFERIGSDLMPYSFLHIFPQDQHEQLLIERLEALGVSVERRTELVGFTDEGGRVIARLRGPEDREETCEACYIAGCDGAHSIVRGTIGIGLPGGVLSRPV